ncbi:1-deoxy-D-xylulose-5-phosphate reductoisomerase [Erysipelotrichaceae bacterium RD49]|nr:1-deoxy-D-xylulose-5-phosphate reductoisomerase [Erysipelotrichaceae bacterium RD49]
MAADVSSTPRKVLLLGATGSIGRQTLDVIAQHPQDFILTGISAGHDQKGLEQILKAFPSVKSVGLSALNEDTEIEGLRWYGGQDQMARLAKEADYDLMVNAVVGFRGLKPTLAAIEQGKDLALANKESLVCGGELVLQALKNSPTHLTPIDSEHSAIFQCLQGNDAEDVARLIITASGGSLRDLSRDQLAGITPAQALKHPSWNMGARITIDSSTMVNKGFEVIEAHYLFNLPYEKIETVLHPQSIVHSMVEYKDHAIIAQLGSADMRLPIQYALYAPRRPVLKEDKPLDMTKSLDLNFKAMDFERFPMLKTAIETGKRKGNAGCIFNAADEQAVEMFLKGEIGYLQIEEAIQKALETIDYIADPSYEDLEMTDHKTRQWVWDAFHQ